MIHSPSKNIQTIKVTYDSVTVNSLFKFIFIPYERVDKYTKFPDVDLFIWLCTVTYRE